jgi:protein required for attachment to host cells
MSTRDACIWVLITDGVTARICSTEDGLATPIVAPVPVPRTSAGTSNHSGEMDARAYRAWFRGESQRFFGGGAKRQFALHLAQLLNEGAEDGAFGGLIVIASPQIDTELQHALSCKSRALLIGNVVRDLSLNIIAEDFGAELRH